MEQAAASGSQVLEKPHQRALAMAVMHGARRHLRSALDKFCPNLPVEVSTIHSFALMVVNRWRRSLDLAASVAVCETSCGLIEKYSRTQATFDEVITLACKLLESPTVSTAVAETYPLVIVDEFQDCEGGTLKLVQTLRGSCELLLAADDFQFLQGNGVTCPAVEWIRGLGEREPTAYEDLTKCRRTDNRGILRAARALRDNVTATERTVPVYWAPKPEMAAWRIVERFLPWDADKQIRSGTCALIVLSPDDVLLDKLLLSFERQLAKRSTKSKVSWSRQLSEDKQQEQILELLGVSGRGPVAATWDPSQVANHSQATAVARQIIRFSKLRGIDPIPQELAEQLARVSVHNIRAFGRGSPRFQVLTIHGAKNREFDHVFVFWGYKNAGWSVEQQRRLLYNAVTRARRDCTVLVLGDRKRAEQDPVISLLGRAQPAIDPAWKNKERKPAGNG